MTSNGMKPPRIRIGIDPGKVTGYAITENGELRNLLSGNFWWVVDMFRLIGSSPVKDDHDVHVYIEDPNLIATTYRVHKGSAIEDVNSLLKKAQNVGSNKREASLLCELMDDLGIKYTRCKPQTGKRAEKWDHLTFKKFFPYWDERTNEHTRDAARLVAGR